MIRFSEDSNHNCTGYIFAYDRGGATHGGLYKINGGQFKTSSLVQLVSFPTVKWTYQAYDTVRIKALGDNIQVWVNGTRVANYTDSDPIEAGSYGFFSFSQADSRFTSITGTAELAHFTAAFNANGGTLSGNSSKTVTSTKTYGTLPTATRTGYTFAGWYDAKTGGNKITSTSTVNIAADTTFYAHWTPIASTVNFDANGGTVSTTSKTVYYDGTMGTMPTPTRKGYTFKGWCTDKNGAGEYVTSDYKIAWTTATTSTLYAQWTINEYSIETSSTGSGAISNDSKVTYLENSSIFIESAEGFELTGLKIDGVSVAPVKSYIFSNVENNHTVEATFTMTQTRKMELLSKGYDWIDLKLN